MKTPAVSLVTATRRLAIAASLCAGLSLMLAGLAAAADVVAEIRLCSNNAPVAGAQVSLVARDPNCTPETCTIFSGTTDMQGKIIIPYTICHGDPDDTDFRVQRSGQSPVVFISAFNPNGGGQATWNTSATSATGACSISGSGTPTLVVKVN